LEGLILAAARKEILTANCAKEIREEREELEKSSPAESAFLFTLSGLPFRIDEKPT
jgi:hypothetical protein